MSRTELIDKVISIIKKHTRKEVLGAYSCALKGHYPLNYEKCINEIDELAQLITGYVPTIDETNIEDPSNSESGLIIKIN